MSEAQQQPDDQIDAHFPTPEGAVIRLRGEETDDGWTEKVEVVRATVMTSNGRAKSDDAEVTVLYEGQGLRPTQVYNRTIEPYIELELEAAREIMEEAEAQGDTITYMNQKEYVSELEEQLPEEEA